MTDNNLQPLRAIVNGRIIAVNEVGDFVERENMAIIFGEKILSIVPVNRLANFANDIDEIINVKGNFVAPGFINVHIHGAMGHDTMDATDEALAAMAEFLPQTGVTAFLPTTMTNSWEKITAALNAVRSAKQTPPSGATILGAHMEGPFINPRYSGAQSAKDIIPADFSLVEPFVDVIRIITFAPETLAYKALARFVVRCTYFNIAASIGHTATDYQTASSAVFFGAKSFTHVFNAMSGVHHRTGGAALAALIEDATVELIADNIHVSPEAQQLVWQAKGGQNVALITDSIRACGIGDGESELGGQKVFVENNVAKLADGTIAGSLLTMERAMQKFHFNTGASIPQLVTAATKTPAKLIGEYDQRGSLEDGKQADMVIFDDKINIKQTIIGGRTVYQSKGDL